MYLNLKISNLKEKKIFRSKTGYCEKSFFILNFTHLETSTNKLKTKILTKIFFFTEVSVKKYTAVPHVLHYTHPFLLYLSDEP